MDSASSSGDYAHHTDACAGTPSDAPLMVHPVPSALTTPHNAPPSPATTSQQAPIIRPGGGAVIFLREEGARTFVPMCRSHSVTLRELADDLGVSSVLECDAEGNVFPRAVAFDSPSDVLHSGHHYIVRRDAAAESGESRVTFRAKITVQEYELDHATPSLLSDSGSSAGVSVSAAGAADTSAAGADDSIDTNDIAVLERISQSAAPSTHSPTSSTQNGGAGVRRGRLESDARVGNEAEEGRAEALTTRSRRSSESAELTGSYSAEAATQEEEERVGGCATRPCRSRSSHNNSTHRTSVHGSDGSSASHHAVTMECMEGNSHLVACEVTQEGEGSNYNHSDEHVQLRGSVNEMSWNVDSARKKRSRDYEGGAVPVWTHSEGHGSDQMQMQVLPARTRFIPFSADLHGTGQAVTVTLEELQRVCETATEEQESVRAHRHECAEEVLTSARRLLFELTGEI